MNDEELKYADYCIEKLMKAYPDTESLSSTMNGKKIENAVKIKQKLIDENWIIYPNAKYKLVGSKKELLEKFGTYSNCIKHLKELDVRQNKKAKYDYLFSKWRFWTFWIVFIFGLFGGIYSAIDLIEKIMKPKQEDYSKSTNSINSTNSDSLNLNNHKLQVK